MRRFFGSIVGDKIFIENDEYNHLKNVLRLKNGDKILVSLNDEYDYVCQIQSMEKNKAVCQVNGKNLCEANPRKNIVLFQALTKRPAFEFIVQKATEIGMTKIVPFETEHSVPKYDKDKHERLVSIAVNACKQCERTIMPAIEDVLSIKQITEMFKEFDLVLFANERTDVGEELKDLENKKNIAIVVGCEGGFTEKEKQLLIDAGAISVSLGKRILRSDTASVAMMSMVSILSGN